MLACCELCRVVHDDPPVLTNPSKATVAELREPLEGEFFAHCAVCKRIQIFVLVLEEAEPDLETPEPERPGGDPA